MIEYILGVITGTLLCLFIAVLESTGRKAFTPKGSVADKLAKPFKKKGAIIKADQETKSFIKAAISEEEYERQQLEAEQHLRESEMQG